MKGYKAFDKGLECKGFKFEVRKTYRTDKVKICKVGFHFCLNPLDVLNYYNLCKSEFAIIDAKGEIVGHEGDTKKATTKIRIGKKMDLRKFVQASIDFLEKEGKLQGSKSAQSGNSGQSAQSGDSSQSAQSGNFSQSAQSGDFSQSAQSGNSSKSAQSGDSSKSAQSGNFSQSAQSGDFSQSAQSGNSSKSAQSGNSSQSAQSGDSSKFAQSGNFSKSAQSGNFSKSAQSGNFSKSAQSGDSSQSAQSGNLSKCESTGKYNVLASIGTEGKAKGIKGNWITLAEYKRNKNGNLIPVIVKSIKIDGKKIKENTLYKLKNKKFTECE